MKIKGKIILAVIAALVVTALFAMALTDKIFFTTLSLDSGEEIGNTDGSVQTPFYLYKDAWGEYRARVADLILNSRRIDNERVLVTLEIVPGIRYSADSLRLEFYSANIYNALKPGNPQNEEAFPYKYELSGDNSKAVLDFPSFDSRAGEVIYIEFWLDLPQGEGLISDGPVLVDFSIHENSVLKIARHAVKQHVLQLIIPH